MSEDHLAAIMARTDAAVGLLITILVEKGLLTEGEIVNALDGACAADCNHNQSQIVQTIFWSLRSLFSDRSPPSLQ